MSHPLDRYHYEADGVKYDLSIIAKRTSYGWRVVSADMYNENGQYVGVWERSQMPLKLIRNLEAWCKYASDLGIPLDGSDWLDAK
jgi:hypothetical protein